MADGLRIPHDPPFTFTVDGAEVVCAQAAAAWWLPRFATADWLGLIAETFPLLTERLWDRADAFDLDDAARLAIALTEHVTGMGWPRAVRLSATVTADWSQFEAWATVNAHGLDLLTSPPRRALAAAQAMILAACEKEAEVESQLRRMDDPNGVPGITRQDRRRAFTMSAEDIAAMQAPMPTLKGA
jgi:hypothetical protein